MYDRRFTPERISELKENEIFVFGSNLAGAHGGGAARFAYERFGAVWGEGVGLHGQTYAIPTMQGGVDTIKPYVDEFIRFAKENEIFVFGSNLAGAHGGGAARLAYNRFGAVWGEGVGLHGKTYAIPTMQGGVETIKPYVDEFILPKEFVEKL